MTEEEYFRKNYSDFCYGDKPLSPHWDFFQDGVEFGERQSEKKIEELKDALEKLKSVAEFQQSSNMRRHFEIKELEQANHLLGERCNQLLKDKGDLTDELANWKDEWQEQVQKATDEGWERTKLTGRVRELEQQIEKMKCDVKQEQSRWNSCEMQYDLYQRLLDKWEIKEND